MNQSERDRSRGASNAVIKVFLIRSAFHLLLFGVCANPFSATATTLCTMPAATTSAASNRASNSATLNGSVNPSGCSTTVHFQYGTTTSYGHTTTSHSYNGSTTQNVSANISGLSANTTYHFRIVATNSAGTTYGSDRAFATLTATGPPVVTTNPASLIASFSATLNATIDPHGLTSTVHFQYGTTTSYGSTTASQTKTGNTYQNISADISGLAASTTYHFRIVATNSSGTRYGSDVTFTTLAATGPPAVISNSATLIASLSAMLNGTVDPHGLTTIVYFQYGPTTSYGSTTASQTKTGNTYQSVSGNITGLNSNTMYHFRIVAHNSAGTTYGSDVTFTTLTATGRPVVTTNPASLIGSYSATLNSSLDPHGLTTTVYFQYGTTTSYGLTTPLQTKNGNAYQNVIANIVTLSASTTYHFRIVATNSAGTTYGNDRTFATLTATGPPVVTTSPATLIGSFSAKLNGTVYPHGLTTTVYFEYGTTTSYGSTTPSEARAGSTYQNVKADIGGLAAGTTYHFRITATNSSGTSHGADQTFTTLAPPPDESVTWQNNAVHDGFNAASPLVTPLTLKWSRDLSANGVTSISYPLIARGMVFVTTATSNNTNALMALDEHTGITIWSADVSSMYGAAFVDAAYESGKVFVVNNDGLMKAFDAVTGTLLWSVNLPDQFFFTSPPTAANGIVFTGGAESGGTVYAVNETNGQVLWTMPVENGDNSSPAVFLGSVFVSYACPQAYSFNAATGQQLWHYNSCCEGGGGATPVVHAGQVYVRDSYCTQGFSGLVLDATNGTMTGEFNSDRPPAFIGNLALYFQNGTLVGVDIPSGQQMWSFAGDGSLTSAPVMVNQTIYIGSNSGTLYGLNASGQQIWSTQVGAPIPAPDEYNDTLTTGLGSGDGLLVVPTAHILIAYGN